MLRKWMLSLLLMGLPLALGANCWEASVRAGYLYPSSRLVRNMFSNGWVEYQAEGSYYFSAPWSAWANVGYGYKHGHSIGLHEKTNLTLVPVSGGLACRFNYGNPISIRLGLGASYSFLNTNNHSPYVHRHLDRGTVGWVAKADVRYLFCNCFFIDLFCDYNYSVFHYKGEDPNLCIGRFDFDLSALRAGLGVGMAF